MMTYRTRGLTRESKLYILLLLIARKLTFEYDQMRVGHNYSWTQNDSHQHPLYMSAKIERCGNCRRRNLTNLSILHWYALNVCMSRTRPSGFTNVYILHSEQKQEL